MHFENQQSLGYSTQMPIVIVKVPVIEVDIGMVVEAIDIRGPRNM